MARQDRCDVCDYSEQLGAGHLGVNPGGHGKVRRHGTDYLCDVCLAAVGENLADLTLGEDNEV